MDSNSSMMLALLRSSLWQKAPEPEFSASAVDWNGVLSLASMHSVLPLVADGISFLPEGCRPSPQVLMKLHSAVVATARTHSLVADVTADAVSRLRAAGVRPVLLKGQGLAANYPDPRRRTCGDIDLYVGEDGYGRAAEVFADGGSGFAECTHHLHLKWRGVTLEIHRTAGVLGGRTERFRQWSSRMLEDGSCRSMEIAGETVLLPPVRFDALYVMYHLYRHFISSGAGLRQLCDWAMYLHRFSREIDRDALEQDLRLLSLSEGWKVTGCIVSSLLGMPQDEIPAAGTWSPSLRRRAAVAAGDIVRYGNFGAFNPSRRGRPEGYLAGKLFSAARTFRRMAMVSRVFPGEAARYSAYYLGRGIRMVALDIMKNRNKTDL